MTCFQITKRLLIYVLDQSTTIAENTEFKNGSAEQKAKIYYESCLDTNDIVEKRGIKPMLDLIESVSIA